MCTVAFVPDPAGGYLLGHNRDERRTRPRGLPPRGHVVGGTTALAPFDPEGGGSWIGVNEAGLTLCLLNAAEADPARRLRQPRSRGLLLWELLRLDDARMVGDALAARRHSLGEVRAFHLVVIQPGRSGRPARATRHRWEGLRLVAEEHRGPCLFVSSSIDQPAVAQARERQWDRLIRRCPRPDREALVAWLASHEPRRGSLSVCMHRPEARTVSRTLVSVAADGIEMAYLDGSPCSPSSPEHAMRL